MKKKPVVVSPKRDGCLVELKLKLPSRLKKCGKLSRGGLSKPADILASSTIYQGIQNNNSIQFNQQDSQFKSNEYQHDYNFCASSFIPCWIHALDSAAYLSIVALSFNNSLILCLEGTCLPFSTPSLCAIRSSQAFKCGNSSISTPAHPAAATHPQCEISAIDACPPTR